MQLLASIVFTLFMAVWTIGYDDRFFDDRRSPDHTGHSPDGCDDGLVDAHIMADDFQRGRTGHRQDGSLERA